jgi:hypothetical protein
MTHTLYLIRETEKSRLFCLDPKNDEPSFWIPVSITTYIKKHAEVTGEYRKCTVTIEDWKSKELGLEDES